MIITHLSPGNSNASGSNFIPKDQTFAFFLHHTGRPYTTLQLRQGNARLFERPAPGIDQLISAAETRADGTVCVDCRTRVPQPFWGTSLLSQAIAKVATLVDITLIVP